MIEKAHIAIFGLNVHIKDNVGHLPPDLAIKMFDKQIRHILDYACEVFYIGKQDYDIEKVHLGYLKFLLNIKPSSCRPSVYAECDRFLLAIKHKIQVLMYWKHLSQVSQKQLGMPITTKSLPMICSPPCPLKLTSNQSPVVGMTIWLIGGELKLQEF